MKRRVLTKSFSLYSGLYTSPEMLARMMKGKTIKQPPSKEDIAKIANKKIEDFFKNKTGYKIQTKTYSRQYWGDCLQVTVKYSESDQEFKAHELHRERLAKKRALERKKEKAYKKLNKTAEAKEKEILKALINKYGI